MRAFRYTLYTLASLVCVRSSMSSESIEIASQFKQAMDRTRRAECSAKALEVLLASSQVDEPVFTLGMETEDYRSRVLLLESELAPLRVQLLTLTEQQKNDYACIDSLQESLERLHRVANEYKHDRDELSQSAPQFAALTSWAEKLEEELVAKQSDLEALQTELDRQNSLVKQTIESGHAETNRLQNEREEMARKLADWAQWAEEVQAAHEAEFAQHAMKHEEQCAQQAMRHEAEIAQQAMKHEAEFARQAMKHEEQFAQQAAQHGAEIAQLTANRDEEAAIVHQREMAQLISQHEANIAQMAAQQEFAVAEMASAALEELGAETRISELTWEHEAAIRALKNQHEAELAKNEATIAQMAFAHEATVAQMASTHEAAIAQMAYTHEATLAQIAPTHEADVAKYEATVAQIASAQEAAIAQMAFLHEAEVSKYEATVAQMASAHEATVAQMASTHEAAIAQMASKHEASVAKMVSAHEIAVTDMASTHAATVSEMEAVVVQATEDKLRLLDELDQRMVDSKLHARIEELEAIVVEAARERVSVDGSSALVEAEQKLLEWGEWANEVQDELAARMKREEELLVLLADAQAQQPVVDGQVQDVKDPFEELYVAATNDLAAVSAQLTDANLRANRLAELVESKEAEWERRGADVMAELVEVGHSYREAMALVNELQNREQAAISQTERLQTQLEQVRAEAEAARTDHEVQVAHSGGKPSSIPVTHHEASVAQMADAHEIAVAEMGSTYAATVSEMKALLAQATEDKLRLLDELDQRMMDSKLHARIEELEAIVAEAARERVCIDDSSELAEAEQKLLRWGEWANEVQDELDIRIKREEELLALLAAAQAQQTEQATKDVKDPFEELCVTATNDLATVSAQLANATLRANQLAELVESKEAEWERRGADKMTELVEVGHFQRESMALVNEPENRERTANSQTERLETQLEQVHSDHTEAEAAESYHEAQVPIMAVSHPVDQLSLPANQTIQLQPTLDT